MDVSADSPLYGYLSPGYLITKLDGNHIHTTKEWMEMTYLLEKQMFQTTNHYISNKGYCVPNLVIAQSKNAEIIDNQFKCPNDLTLFTTISCADSSTVNEISINESDHQLTMENIYCFPAKGVLGEKKCGNGWNNVVNNDTNCSCTEVYNKYPLMFHEFLNVYDIKSEHFFVIQDESCSTPIHIPGVSWVEITFSRPYSSECTQAGNEMGSGYNKSGSEDGKCGGSFVFIGDMMSMTRSIWLTEYQPRWLYVFAYFPDLVEKLLVNSFHVSLMLALLNSLPVCIVLHEFIYSYLVWSVVILFLFVLKVYYLDGESILEVALCCFSSLTPTVREAVLRSSLVAGTLFWCLLFVRTLLFVIS